MRNILVKGAASAFVFFFLLSYSLHAEESKYTTYFDEPADNGVSDPIEPVNRAFFEFNDKLYFWIVKPIATVIDTIIPQDFRICIRNAFDNLTAPVRIVNNLLQGKIHNSGVETARFLINSTVGIVGMGDPAKNSFNLHPREEDLGQTFGTFGIGEGFYICWPFLGPSTLRDTFGTIGDGFLDGASYLGGGNIYATAGIKMGDRVNSTSLFLGEYESFKEASVDPYVSMRNAYHQLREKEIRNER